MKTKTIAALVAIALAAVYAIARPQVDIQANTNEGIQFYTGTWNETLKLAQKENKLIFLDVYATWCGPCKKLKANTFSDFQVGSFYNQNFINVAFDGEQGEGKMLMDKYDLNSFPSLLFLDGGGNVVGQFAGYYKPQEFIKLGQNFSKSNL